MYISPKVKDSILGFIFGILCITILLKGINFRENNFGKEWTKYTNFYQNGFRGNFNAIKI